MTDTLRQAAQRTTHILNTVDHMRLILGGHQRKRTNELGILADPANYLAVMKVARDEIDRAIAMHASIDWPDESDYHAL